MHVPLALTLLVRLPEGRLACKNLSHQPPRVHFRNKLMKKTDENRLVYLTWKSAIKRQRPPFYGHYTGQPALASTSS